jgi:hypothetical protein
MRIDREPKHSKKSCPNVTFSTTNPTGPDLGSNRGLRGEEPATDLLSYGTALTAGMATVCVVVCRGVGEAVRPRGGFEVLTAVVMKSSIFWVMFRRNVSPPSSGSNKPSKLPP